MRAVVDETASLETRLDQRGAYTRAKVLSERLVIEPSAGGAFRRWCCGPARSSGLDMKLSSPYGTIAMAGRWIAYRLGTA